MRAFFLLPLIVLTFAVTGCGDDVFPREGCTGHGGFYKSPGGDATNGKVPFGCKDGTAGWVRL